MITNHSEISRASTKDKKTLGMVYIQVGGLERAFAISDMLAITVLIPLPFPSTCQHIFHRQSATTSMSESVVLQYC